MSAATTLLDLISAALKPKVSEKPKVKERRIKDRKEQEKSAKAEKKTVREEKAEGIKPAPESKVEKPKTTDIKSKRQTNIAFK